MAKSDLIGGTLWETYSRKVNDRMSNPRHLGEITEERAAGLGGRLVVADWGAESSLVGRGAGLVVLQAAFVWLFYLAVEPYARRLRPWTLVSWTRFLGGGLGDPVVGRDTLVGLTWAVLLFALVCFFPFYLIVLNSFVDNRILNQQGYQLYLKAFSADSYRYLFQGSQAFTSYRVSIFVTAVGSTLATVITSMYAFVLSNRKASRSVGPPEPNSPARGP